MLNNIHFRSSGKSKDSLFIFYVYLFNIKITVIIYLLSPVNRLLLFCNSTMFDFHHYSNHVVKQLKISLEMKNPEYTFKRWFNIILY